MWAGVMFFLFCVGFVFYVLAQFHLRLNKKQASHKNQQMALNTWNKREQENSIVEIKIKIVPKKTKNVVPPREIFDSFGNCILYTYSMLLVVSLPRLPRSWSIRLLTGWYWIYCILVVVAYRASLTAILANPAPR